MSFDLPERTVSPQRLYSTKEIAEAFAGEGNPSSAALILRRYFEELKAKYGNNGIGGEIYAVYDCMGDIRGAGLARFKSRPASNTFYGRDAADLVITDIGFKSLCGREVEGTCKFPVGEGVTKIINLNWLPAQVYPQSKRPDAPEQTEGWVAVLHKREGNISIRPAGAQTSFDDQVLDGAVISYVNPSPSALR